MNRIWSGNVTIHAFSNSIVYSLWRETVYAIGPGLFRTEMTEDLFALKPYMENFCQHNPSDRPANPGELNGAVLFLSSDASKYVQGQFIVVDGGDQLV